ncbi:MAG: hypothetical protein HQ592_08705, partial [Planctomycetes bacterium]|nr:hypothetical protein [Planctomycetota bacterium]
SEALRKQMGEARKNYNKDAMKEVMAKMRKLREGQGKAQGQLREQIMGTLTDEQKKLFEKMNRRRGRMRGGADMFRSRPAKPLVRCKC